MRNSPVFYLVVRKYSTPAVVTCSLVEFLEICYLFFFFSLKNFFLLAAKHLHCLSRHFLCTYLHSEFKESSLGKGNTILEYYLYKNTNNPFSCQGILIIILNIFKFLYLQ